MLYNWGNLLLERGNPRSLTYQLDRLADNLRHLPREPGRGFTLNARLRDITARLREADAEGLVRGHDGVRPELAGLVTVLEELAAGLAGVAQMIEELHFAHPAPLRAIAATPGWATSAGWDPLAIDPPVDSPVDSPIDSGVDLPAGRP